MKNTRPLVTSTILLFALLPTLLLSSSCDLKKLESEKEFENPLAHVGTMHNQGLDHILGDVKEAEIQESDLIEERGPDVLSNVVETSTRTFLKEKDLGAGSIDAMEIGMNVVHTERNKDLQRDSDDGPLRLLPDSLRGDLTNKQKRYLREVWSVVLNEPPMSKLRRRLNELGRSARDELSTPSIKILGVMMRTQNPLGRSLRA